MILASDRSLYTGITTDIDRRFAEHKRGVGAKYFHGGRLPVRVVYRELSDGRASASRREAAIKKLSRQEKISLCENFQEEQTSKPLKLDH
jgi:putative endonuclease